MKRPPSSLPATSTRWRPALELAIVTTTLTLAITGWHNPARPILALIFVFTMPGLSIARLCRFGTIAIELTIGVALSVSIATVGAQCLLWFHAWNPAAYVIGVSALTIPMLTCEILTAHGPSTTQRYRAIEGAPT